MDDIGACRDLGAVRWEGEFDWNDTSATYHYGYDIVQGSDECLTQDIVPHFEYAGQSYQFSAFLATNPEIADIENPSYEVLCQDRPFTSASKLDDCRFEISSSGATVKSIPIVLRQTE